MFGKHGPQRPGVVVSHALAPQGPSCFMLCVPDSSNTASTEYCVCAPFVWCQLLFACMAQLAQQKFTCWCRLSVSGAWRFWLRFRQPFQFRTSLHSYAVEQAVPTRLNIVVPAAGRVSVSPRTGVYGSNGASHPQSPNFTSPPSPLVSRQLAEGHLEGHQHIKGLSAQAACLSNQPLQRTRVAAPPGDLRLHAAAPVNLTLAQHSHPSSGSMSTAINYLLITAAPSGPLIW